LDWLEMSRRRNAGLPLGAWQAARCQWRWDCEEPGRGPGTNAQDPGEVLWFEARGDLLEVRERYEYERDDVGNLTSVRGWHWHSQNPEVEVTRVRTCEYDCWH
jgi:hypothetical protein